MASIIGAVRRVHVEAPIRNYIDRLCDFTQHQLEEVRLGLTPRGATALTRMARAMAASQGRDTVGVDDVRTVAPYVMSHRLLLTPSAEGDGISPEALVARALDKVSEPEALRA